MKSPYCAALHSRSRPFTIAAALRPASTAAIAESTIATVPGRTRCVDWTTLGNACLLAISCLGVGAVHAQALDAGFPTVSSSVSNTAAAFLDQGTTDIDTAGILIPRNVGTGMSMVFTATESGLGGTIHSIGLRRMVRTGAPSFAPNTPTGVTARDEASVADGVEVGPGVCMLNRGFDSGPLNSTATIYCLSDSGALTATAETPSGTAYHRYAGGMVQVGGELVVAGAFSASSSNAEARYTRLYLERRRASDLVLVGSRVDHDISLSVPSPAPVKDLTVAKLAVDAQGRWLVAGHVTRQQGSTLTEAFVARFNADFSRDMTFGTDGVVNLNFGVSGANRFNGVASDLAVLDNGVIVVAGLGCIAVDCGSAGNTLTRQIIVKNLLPNGATAQFSNSPTTTELNARLPQLEATRKPFIPGEGVGFVLVRPFADGAVSVSTEQVSASGLSTFVRFNNFRLRYTSNPNTSFQQSFASLATTQNAGRTRHYVAWTYKADNSNTTDTDMVMGELQALTLFADGFE